MSDDVVTCGHCGEPVTGEPPDIDPAKRKPCPECGSTTRAIPLSGRGSGSGSATAQAQVVTYPQKLLTIAQKLIDDGEYSIAAVVAHMACEIATERSLSEAFVTKGITYLEDSVMKLLNGYNLTNNRIRRVYTALTGDEVQKVVFWQKLTDSVARRNDIIHAGVLVGKGIGARGNGNSASLRNCKTSP